MSDKLHLVSKNGVVITKYVNWNGPNYPIESDLHYFNKELYASGDTLQAVVMTTPTWQKLVTNSTVLARSGKDGICVTPSPYSKLPEQFKSFISCVLNVIPWVIFHIDDSEVLVKEISSV